MRILFLAIAATAFVAAGPSFAKSSEPQDHPLLPRFLGAEIRSYRQPSTERIVLPTGPLKDAVETTETRGVEGRVTHLDYVITPALSSLEIANYYRTALVTHGFETAFACDSLRTCGDGMGAFILNSGSVAPTGFADGLFGDRMQVIVARRADTEVLLHIYEGPDRSLVYEAVIEGARPSR